MVSYEEIVQTAVSRSRGWPYNLTFSKIRGNHPYQVKEFHLMEVLQ
jgi:hypothetical protein